jgi:endonuclease/exonuclease/phosphatase family metal-dependent hydrolase
MYNSRTIASTLLVLLACFTAQAAAEPADLKVMSFNVRFAKAGHSEAATENNWDDAKHPRRERAIRVIRERSPDLLGVQEARAEQIKDLQEAFPEYAFYGVGRDDGKMGGELSGIFYRKDRFTQQDAGTFWLSDTPEKPGTTFSFNGLPRVASWVRLLDGKTGREFVLLNQHWDHQDESAREKAAALARKQLTAIAKGAPTIVMGDLNSFEDTKAFQTLLSPDDAGRKIADSYRELHPERLPNEVSFNGWNGKKKGSRIDFILHSDDFTATAAEIDRTSYDGLWPSDHYPVTATLRYKGE